MNRERDFETLEQEAFMSLVHTADGLLAEVNDLLKPEKLSAPLYSVLRILRSAKEDGLPCKEISSRLVSRDPDVTRLTDRLLRLGLAERRRSAKDRRVVRVSITTAGRKLLAGIDDLVADLHLRQFGLLSRKKLRKFLATLELIREG